jgi:DNA-binding NtrC family response regulator
MPAILLIDDNPLFLKALSASLLDRAPDMVVETANTANAALLLIAVTDYDAIICDVRMPSVDGFALLKQIKLMRPETPVLLITGYGDQEAEKEALRLGAYAFIHKPVQVEPLLAAVGRAERARHAMEQSRAEHQGSRPEPIKEKTEQILNQLKERNDELRKIVMKLTEGKKET